LADNDGDSRQVKKKPKCVVNCVVTASRQDNARTTQGKPGSASLTAH